MTPIDPEGVFAVESASKKRRFTHRRLTGEMYEMLLSIARAPKQHFVGVSCISVLCTIELLIGEMELPTYLHEAIAKAREAVERAQK